jgi:hypothetical protein
MGIRGLLTAIVERKETCSTTVDLIEVAKEKGGIEILVDFYSFEHLLVRALWNGLGSFKFNDCLKILGAEYETMDAFVGKIIRNLKDSGIVLVFYADGNKGASNLETKQKMDTWKYRFRKECMRKREILAVCAGQGNVSDVSEDSIIRGVCLEIQMVQTIRDAGCEIVQMSAGEADSLIALDLQKREKAFAVLSNDSDFAVLPKKPQRLMCGVVSSQGIQKMLQVSCGQLVRT